LRWVSRWTSRTAPRARSTSATAADDAVLRAAVGEQAPKLGLGVEQPRALRLRFGEHRVQQPLGFRLLIGRELELVLQLQDV